MQNLYFSNIHSKFLYQNTALPWSKNTKSIPDYSWPALCARIYFAYSLLWVYKMAQLTIQWQPRLPPFIYTSLWNERITLRERESRRRRVDSQDEGSAPRPVDILQDVASCRGLLLIQFVDYIHYTPGSWFSFMHCIDRPNALIRKVLVPNEVWRAIESLSLPCSCYRRNHIDTFGDDYYDYGAMIVQWRSDIYVIGTK